MVINTAPSIDNEPQHIYIYCLSIRNQIYAATKYVGPLHAMRDDLCLCTPYETTCAYARGGDCGTVLGHENNSMAVGSPCHDPSQHAK